MTIGYTTRTHTPYPYGTWLEAEDYAYPSGAISAGRKARVRLRQNPHNPIVLPYGAIRVVAVGVPDTFFSIPARLRYQGKTIKGFVSADSGPDGRGDLTFTPEAV